MTEYHGNVHVGGPAQTHELAQLMITKVAVGPMDNNAYLLRCRLTDEQVLIDAANDANTLLNVIGSEGISKVITTHRHGDHWQALAEVVARTSAQTIAGQYDAEGIEVPTDEPVEDGDRIHFGQIGLEVIHLVGHTPGSIALLYDDPTGPPHVFTGDSLFPGGVGNTRGDAENFRSLLNDVETKLFDRLPDETWVYPGHGADTSLGAERPSLPEWRARGW
ncbi:glyoxylase-like metal-dependent hydrolase (beta-lactamase superfamily II) [Kribbella orskensis]|uniref:Glyoxylase-like metal-dependent hydrolase (Beta-lactamase superfamily II) n=1 Tax=Kribbella orskensis TaxID=2512216 RepID=A0ABY2BGJ3_9ACTN|nr:MULTISPECIES: MBL fold metallo-hydrolase [Kribbella]TCN38045.1 glyoxylase-like metal-dependent hydrolase (beta-lactamase superfamily II) [Kribbella sp. VKM Ac-2500]TCO19532.1 glyoxylase-like metal-dependent hydrolase (beta-lactamase superfamily II) [Kribbella orskensis]